MPSKILVMGLPGAGKTAIATEVARGMRAVHFNADEVRREINKDLGFDPADRIEQARRMGALCDIVLRAGHSAVADFVCPTPECRDAFGHAFVVWVDRIKAGRFEDTNKLWVPPAKWDLRLSADALDENVDVVLGHFGIPRRRDVSEGVDVRV